MIDFYLPIRDLEETEGCFDGTPHDESRRRDRRAMLFSSMLENNSIKMSLPKNMEEEVMKLLAIALKQEGAQWYRSYHNNL